METKKKIRRLRMIIIVLVVMLVVSCGLLVKEENKNKQLENKIEQSVTSELADVEAKSFINHCDDDHYNILFIGNSITKHSKTDYWWSSKRGMAASTTSKDYVHQSVKRLKSKTSKEINYFAYSYIPWEVLTHDVAETYPLIDPYLSKGQKLDAVVLQLGENVTYTANFTSDYRALIAYLKKKAPAAQIITIGDFWANKTKDRIKKKVAQREHVEYVDLKKIQDRKDYETGLGTKIKGDDNKWHVIRHKGVALHPNDRAMEWIAEKIINTIKF